MDRLRRLLGIRKKTADAPGVSTPRKGPKEEEKTAADAPEVSTPRKLPKEEEKTAADVTEVLKPREWSEVEAEKNFRNEGVCSSKVEYLGWTEASVRSDRDVTRDSSISKELLTAHVRSKDKSMQDVLHVSKFGIKIVGGKMNSVIFDHCICEVKFTAGGPLTTNGGTDHFADWHAIYVSSADGMMCHRFIVEKLGRYRIRQAVDWALKIRSEERQRDEESHQPSLSSYHAPLCPIGFVWHWYLLSC